MAVTTRARGLAVGDQVRATLRGEAFEAAIVSRTKRHGSLLPADAERAAGVSAGDTVELRVGPPPRRVGFSPPPVCGELAKVG